MLVQKENKIGDVVASNFHAARIFENFGLDFCCGGKKTINDACGEKGINTDYVLNELNKINEEKPADIHYDKWSADFLADYIVNNHHSYVLNTIPTIEHHLQKVLSKHGEKHPELAKVMAVFTILKDELLEHMAKEERMLFPYIKKMRIAQQNNFELNIPPFGAVNNPIKVMESEHENAGELMKEIHTLTNNFAPPEDTCTGYRVLYSELKEFEKDLYMHIHLENNVLFPKAKQLETEITELQKEYNKL